MSVNRFEISGGRPAASGAANGRGVSVQIAAVREDVVRNAERDRRVPASLIRLALNEAEGLASETGYPGLVFPELAAEKVRSLDRWAAAQDAIRRASPVVALSA